MRTDAEVLKRCSHCQESKSPEHFARSRATRDGRSYICKVCMMYYRAARRAGEQPPVRPREAARALRATQAKVLPLIQDPVQHRESCITANIKKHNLTRDQYDQRLAEQDTSCASCGITFTYDVVPHIDHDHSCCPGPRSCGSCVRGLLCGPCNSGLGYFRDDPALLLGAIEYLQRTRTAVEGGR